MSFELMQAFLRCDWPKGDGHTGQMRVAKVLGLYAELAEDGEAWPSQRYVAKELGLPLRDVQNAIKVLKSAGHLLKISGHETGERGITYRVLIPAVAKAPPDLPSPGLTDLNINLEPLDDLHKDRSGESLGVPSGAPPGDANGDSHGNGPSTTERPKDKETSYRDGITTARSRLSPARGAQSNHDRRVDATKQALNEAARTDLSDGTFADRRQLLDDAYFNSLLGSLKQHPTDDVQGLRQLALEQLIKLLVNDSAPPVHFDQHDFKQMLSYEDD